LNQIAAEDRAVHDWYDFVLSFPPHLVREYLQRFDCGPDSLMLDPFSGTGTTLVECKKQAVPSLGIEANPLAQFASSVKLNWSVNPDALLAHAEKIGKYALHALNVNGIVDGFTASEDQIAALMSEDRLLSLSPDAFSLLLQNSISPLPLHKVLTLSRAIDLYRESALIGFERLALATLTVRQFSNLHFGPEVGVQKPKSDVEVVGAWLEMIERMVADLRYVRSQAGVPALSVLGDARALDEYLAGRKISAVFTSPPYPNEKDYTRTTRLEAVLLGFIRNKQELRALKQGLLRSNTRNVYVYDTDDQWAAQYPRVQRLAKEIEARRLELGKTSGFERLYARVTQLYFGGMARHLQG